MGRWAVRESAKTALAEKPHSQNQTPNAPKTLRVPGF
jgi:hypothetical protein